jgi:hypothetical protein
MAYLIYCEDNTDIVPSDELRTEHRSYLDAHQDVVRASGMLVNEGSETSVGRVMFTIFDRREDAENFLSNEPYFKFGRVRSHMIKPMLIRKPK